MKTTIAFDVDGTLITFDDTPCYDNIFALKYFVKLGTQVYVWSGGGLDYAQHWVNKLGLDKYVTVIEKGSMLVDICFDDESVSLAKINVRV